MKTNIIYSSSYQINLNVVKTKSVKIIMKSEESTIEEMYNLFPLVNY
jgi:hypothetical protein